MLSTHSFIQTVLKWTPEDRENRKRMGHGGERGVWRVGLRGESGMEGRVGCGGESEVWRGEWHGVGSGEWGLDGRVGHGGEWGLEGRVRCGEESGMEWGVESGLRWESGAWRRVGLGGESEVWRGDARRKTQDILLNKQYMFISRGELDSRKM